MTDQELAVTAEAGQRDVSTLSSHVGEKTEKEQALVTEKEKSNTSSHSSLSEQQQQTQTRFTLFMARCKRHPLITGLLMFAAISVVIVVILGSYLGTRKKHVAASLQPGQTVNLTIGGVTTLSTAPIASNFVSFAIEFFFFPDFAGNLTSPNTFSQNLLYNIGNITGQNPFVRIGGNTQDYTIYNESLETAALGTWNWNKSNNYPVDVQIGPAFFESYQTWPGIRLSHGFNMGMANTAAGWTSLLATIPLVCKALSQGNLQLWEYGNEPDLYVTQYPHPLRSKPWTVAMYLEEWRNGTDAIYAGLQESCPDLASNSSYGYVGPSLASDENLSPVRIFEGTDGLDGLNADGLIKEITLHNYMGTTTQFNASLQGTLMNHSNIVSALGHPITREINELKSSSLTNPQDPDTKLPIVLNEANSLMLNSFGPKNLLNVFGNALWTVDYMLYAASLGISRMQMQLGTDFRYSSWQPITTSNMTTATLPPYYGNIAVANMIGNTTEGVPTIVYSDPGTIFESVYTAYVNGSVKRIAIINMNEYNTTTWENGINTNKSNTASRPSRKYHFDLDDDSGILDGVEVSIQRLMANGSDVHSGITWDGWSYNWELDDGKPVRLANVTVGETTTVADGAVEVDVADSSAVILTFEN